MISTLRHRGPDHSAVWTLGSAALAQCALWTTPESIGEKQPLISRDERLVLVADARIDNREELMAALGTFGSPSTEVSDAALILAAYEKWGEDCPAKLDGDFSFALWDSRVKEFFCARSVFGARPFYYHQSEHLFAFASEIKALRVLPQIPTDFNEISIAAYLWDEFDARDCEGTFYRDILRLPPASWMRVSRGKIRIQKFWTPDLSKEIRLGSDAQYEEAFRDVFFRSVEAKLRSVYPVGSMLSGGIDSSSVVCVAREILSRQGGEKKLHTFSGVSADESKCPEKPFMDAVLSRGGFEPHKTNARDLFAYLDFFEEAMRTSDQPLDATYPSWISRVAYRQAHQNGVRVLFDGVDGDHTTCHNSTNGLRYFLLRGPWSRFRQEISSLAAMSKISVWRYGLSFAGYAVASQPLRDTWEWLRGRAPEKSAKNGFLRTSFMKRVHLQDRLRETAAQENQLRSPREDHADRLIDSQLILAMEVTDYSAMAVSVELRHPYADKRLAEFCLALPENQKVRQGWTKWIVRRSLEGVFPKAVQWRSDKANLHGDFLEAFFVQNKKSFQAILDRDLQQAEDYLNVSAVRKLYKADVASRTFLDWIALWEAAAFVSWVSRAKKFV